jgi:hypothetical protein
MECDTGVIESDATFIFDAIGENPFCLGLAGFRVGIDGDKRAQVISEREKNGQFFGIEVILDHFAGVARIGAAID